MRRVLAIVLLALLPLQFSWAAVASYCEHEAEEMGHFGHHDHQHHADVGGTAEPVVDPGATSDVADDRASGTADADCGHCHGYCSVMLTLQPGLPDVPSTAPPGAAANEAGNAHAPARPERPQWLPLA